MNNAICIFNSCMQWLELRGTRCEEYIEAKPVLWFTAEAGGLPRDLCTSATNYWGNFKCYCLSKTLRERWLHCQADRRGTGMRENWIWKAAILSRKLLPAGSGAWQGNLNDRVWSVCWSVCQTDTLVNRCGVCCVIDADDDLTWFLVCCCALSLLGCRGVSLGMGPIGVGWNIRKDGSVKTNTALNSTKQSVMI